MLDQKHEFDTNNEQMLAQKVEASRQEYGTQMNDLKEENAKLKEDL